MDAPPSLPFFPLFHDRYALSMDARASAGPLIVVEEDCYGPQMARKEGLLAADPEQYFQCPPDAEPLAWESLELLLPHMAAQWPAFFSLAQRGDRWTWINRLQGTTTRLTPGDAQTLPRAPLDWLGRQVQEDLILLGARANGETYCVGGHVCFPSGWQLPDKMGQSFTQIHAPVPGFAGAIGGPSDLLMRRLKPGRPVERMNWSVAATNRLDLTPKQAAEWKPARRQVTAENAGERCFFRLERQTLTRLARTGGVLFTIHTFLTPICVLASDPARRRRFLAVLKDMPAATRDYKGLTVYLDALLAYLETDVPESPGG